MYWSIVRETCPTGSPYSYAGTISETLEEVKRCAEKDENLVPLVYEAVKAYATVGEISDMLREFYGEYVEGKSYD